MGSNTQTMVLAMLGGLSISAAGFAVQAQSPAQDETRVITAAALGDAPMLEALRLSTRDAGLRNLIDTTLAAARLDPGAARAAFAQYQDSGGATSAGVATGWSAVASAAFATGDYAGAAVAAAAWRQALAASGDPTKDAAAAQTQSIAEILSRFPPQAMMTAAPRASATTVDAAGLLRTPVTINGLETSAVLDTGANLSVVSATEARRLGLTMATEDGSVGSTSREAVPVRIGVAERMEIAGATLSNVAFLVMEDSALTFPLPGGYHIDAIVGLPIFMALGRTTFDQSGQFRWSPERVEAGSRNVYAHGSDLHVVVEFEGDRLPLHFDTGASASVLSSAATDRHPWPLLDQTETQRLGGAGGVTENQARRLAPLALEIGGTRLCHSALSLRLGSTQEADSLGALGQDVLGAFQSYTLDLGAMTFRLGPPTETPGPVTAGSCPTTEIKPGSLSPASR